MDLIYTILGNSVVIVKFFPSFFTPCDVELKPSDIRVEGAKDEEFG